jgi:hypothetical protein
MLRLAAVGSRRAVFYTGVAGACAYVLRPRVFFARDRAAVVAGYVDPSIIERRTHADEVDKELAEQERMEAVEKAYPYLKGHITRDILDELYYIRAMYSDYAKPLPASSRVILRSRVWSLIENNNLPQETVDGLVKLMEAYGVLRTVHWLRG